MIDFLPQEAIVEMHDLLIEKYDTVGKPLSSKVEPLEGRDAR